VENKKQIYLPWWVWVGLLLLIVGLIAFGLRDSIQKALNRNEHEKTVIVSQMDSIKTVQGFEDKSEKAKLEWDAYISREIKKQTDNEKIIINTDSSTDFKYRVITNYKPPISADFGTGQ